MGELLANAVSTHHTIQPDVLIAVPLHQTRLLERGYNQAFQIADIIGRRLQIPVDQQSVRRDYALGSQVKLNARDRATNMRRAFSAVGNVKGKKVAIVDDVYTTGATAQALATVLIKAGAVSVAVWAFARTP